MNWEGHLIAILISMGILIALALYGVIYQSFEIDRLQKRIRRLEKNSPELPVVCVEPDMPWPRK